MKADDKILSSHLTIHDILNMRQAVNDKSVPKISPYQYVGL